MTAWTHERRSAAASLRERRRQERFDADPWQALLPRINTDAGPDGCWVWLGARQSGRRGGYAVISPSGKTRYVHRIALELKLGRPLLKGEMACHTCDNPPCVNPAHLFLGDASLNGLDMAAKGRDRWSKSGQTT